MRQNKKNKKRNIKGRKPPQFAQLVRKILEDSTVTVLEMMEKAPNKTLDEESGRIKATYDTLPEDCTTIDSLNGNWVFKDARLFRHLEQLEMVKGEFGAEFYNEEGASLMDLRYDKKGRVWGDEIAICGLAYLLIGAGMAEWTQSRSEWASNPDKMPKIKFNKTGKEIYDSIKNDPEAISTGPVSIPAGNARAVNGNIPIFR